MKYILIIVTIAINLLIVPQSLFCQYLDGFYYLLFSLSGRQDLLTSTGAQTFYPADLIKWEGSNLYSSFWKGSAYLGTTRNMDAVEVLSNGDIIFSLSTDWSSYTKKDLIKWTSADGFSMYWDASLYDVPEGNDLNALHINNDGSIIFSLHSDWGAFKNQDLIKWTPGIGFSLYWSPPDFTGNMDGVDILLCSDILFSVYNRWTNAGITYETNDIIKYNFATNSYSLAWDASAFGLGTGSGWNMNAFTTVPIPEPGTWLLFGVSVVGMGLMGWYRKCRS